MNHISTREVKIAEDQINTTGHDNQINQINSNFTFTFGHDQNQDNFPQTINKISEDHGKITESDEDHKQMTSIQNMFESASEKCQQPVATEEEPNQNKNKTSHRIKIQRPTFPEPVNCKKQLCGESTQLSQK